MTSRLGTLKSILWGIVAVWVVLTVARFGHGLGATTAVSDASPWGLWIGFDVMAGVALAAGGFVLAATVYIFRLEKYRPLVRPAILTAFLGYAAVAVGLLYDLGLPWHIWHPLIYWQHHSVLFEVAMCVIFYLTVLALEVSPVVLEHRWFGHRLFQTILKILRRATIPLVIAGIVLSTLHQSSLGSLFLITPFRLHPLWYTSIIYVLFFVSAIALGLMTVALESILAGYFFRYRVRTDLLSGLGVAASVVLGLYTALRLGDLAVQGKLRLIVDGSWESLLFVLELLISAVIPAALLAFRPVRTRVSGLAVCAGLTVTGMILYRIDVSIVAFARPAEMSYFPSLVEIAVTIGIVAASALVFLFFVENFKVYEEEDAAQALRRKPSFDPATLHGLRPPSLAAPRRYSLIFVACAAATVGLLPEGASFSPPPERTPVVAPRTIEGFIQKRSDDPGHDLLLSAPTNPGELDSERTPLMILDGNRDGRFVLFTHERHIKELGDDASCAQCHHQNMPFDENTSCYECHRDMYEITDIFDHSSHIRALGDSGEDDSCVQCHPATAAVKTRETSKACVECHTDMVVAESLVKPPPEGLSGFSAGYMDAMHESCIPCHEEGVAEDEKQQTKEFAASFARCDGCHLDLDGSHLRQRSPYIPGRVASGGSSPGQHSQGDGHER